jgi:Chaperone of endosialidase/Domain of unknown function (DUF5011)
MLKSFFTGVLILFAATFGLHHSPVTTASTPVEPVTKVLIVVNHVSKDPVTLVANTRFETDNRLIFRTPQAITIPGKHGATDGTVQLTVVADQTGSQYDIGAAHLTLPGLAADPTLYKGIYAYTSGVSPQASEVAAVVAGMPNTSNMSTGGNTDGISNASVNSGSLNENPNSTDTATFDPPQSIPQSVLTAPVDATNYVTNDELTKQIQQATNALRSLIYQNESAPNSLPASGGYTNDIALTNDIDQLSGTTLNNVTVNGISGLTAADIPTDITATNYFPLSGGTLTGAFVNTATTSSSFAGALGIGTTSPSDVFAVNGPIYLANTTPSATTNRLYSTGGSLYWAGSLVGGGSVGNWSTDGTNLWRVGGNVGIGTTTPSQALSVAGSGYFSGNLNTASLSVSGLTTLGNATTSNLEVTNAFTLTGNKTYSGTSSPSNSFMFMNGSSLFGTASPAPNGIISPFNLYISGDSVNTTSTGNGNLVGFSILHAVSAGSTGGREALQSNLAIVGTPATIPGQAGYVGGQFMLRGSANLLGTGGSYSNYAGAAFASNANVYLTAGATYYKEVDGEEFDVTVPTGGSVADKYGISIVKGSNDAVRGTYDDSAISISDQDNSSTPGWKYGLSLGSYAGQWGFATDSTLIMAQTRQAGPASPDVALNGVDFRNVAFSSGGFAFASNGFDVDPSGDLSASNLTAGGTLTAAGHVGIGTTTPSVPLFVNGTSGQGTPSLIAGTVAAFQSNAGANFSPHVAIIGGTTGTASLDFGNSGSQNQGQLTWNNLTDTFYLEGGNVGIGTTSPYSRFTVWGANTSGNTAALTIANNASTTELQVFDNGNATLAGTLTQNSDQRLKTNVQSLNNSNTLALIDQLNPVTFNWVDPSEGSTQQVGFIAQQVQTIFPQLISTTSATALTPNGTLGLNYIGLISPIVSAIQGIAHISGDFESNLIAWLGNASNGISDFFAANGHFSNELCVGSTCVTPAQFQAMVTAADQTGGAPSPSGQGSSEASGASATSTPDTPPIITINGDNPAIIYVGDTYIDLGATITGPAQDLNLGINVSVDGGATTTPDQISIDTSTSSTHTISYSATDQSGETGYATRSVIVEAATSTP